MTAPKKSTPAKGVHYVHMGTLPVHFGVTFDPNAFYRELKRLGITEPIEALRADRAGRTHHFCADGKMDVILIVCRLERGRSLSESAGLITHECVHAWQWICEIIGEPSAGAELESYAVQWMVQNAVEILLEHHNRRDKL